MKTYRITCKKKHTRFERVEEIGCIDLATRAEARFTEDEAIRLIESGVAHFIVSDDRGNESVVQVEELEGRKFLATKRDGVTSDNLLAMPECSSKPVISPPLPPPRPVAPPRVHGVFTPFQLAAEHQFCSGEIPPLQEFYPQFLETPVPPHCAAEQAFIGTIQPFDESSDLLRICSDLREDRIVNVQAGHLRHQENCSGLHRRSIDDARFVEMHTCFTVLALRFGQGRHPQAYALKPEISRQCYPLHPHLRDDLDLFFRGRYRQPLCAYFAPDGVCQSLVDFLDFVSIFLAKHLMWEKTLKPMDRAASATLFQPEPGTPVIDSTLPRLGPEYSARNAPLLIHMNHPETRRFGWHGVWPGSAAPHDLESNLRLPGESECHCGSGRPYARCHQQMDTEWLRHYRNHKR